MKIYGLKINGVTNPMGFRYDKILCSWKVAATNGKKQRNVTIQVSTRKDFSILLYQLEDINLACNETELKFELLPYTTYYWRVMVEADNGESAASDIAFFETAKLSDEWEAEWIGPQKADEFHPIVWKEFQTEKKVNRARLYICGVGLYEAYINGAKVGNEYLASYVNDYIESLQYQTYDVTSSLTGLNRIEVLLGKGWYLGVFGPGNTKGKFFGDRMGVIAELRIEYEDGTAEVLATDSSWFYQGSDIEESGIYYGEIINHLLWQGKENQPKKAEVISVPAKLVERFSLPVVEKEKITPVAIIHTPAGETVVDMGQNFSGIMEFEADFPAGTVIELQCGEVLQQGNFYRDNYRDAQAILRYVSDGRKETVRPHFTFYGYRYLKVTGWPGEIKTTDIIGKDIYSDMDRTGFVTTSNEKINRLYENCIWSQRSNSVDLPTDCPQRNERMGWTGDAQVFAPTASYNMDIRAFYHKYLSDIRSEQLRADGCAPNYIPTMGRKDTGCSVWGDVATFVPDQLYKIYGNLKQMASYYPMMKDWVDYMLRISEQKGNRYRFIADFQFGDWLAQDGMTPQSFKGSTEDDFIGCSYYYESTRMLSSMAKRLGKEEDALYYGKLVEEIKKAITLEYFTASGRFSLDTQTAYILVLKFDLAPDKARVIRQFKERLKKDCYKIKGGFIGAPLLCTTLCENGMENLAYHFLFNEEFPGWLYEVNLGATTIWERWNSLLEDGTISGTGMNSLNHYAYGSVVEFFYEYIGGIRPAEPGYRKAIIAPLPSMKLREFHCSFDSISGRYVSDWKILQDGTFQLRIEIPFNCEAEVILPRYAIRRVVAVCNGQTVIVPLSADGKLTLDSGIYEFSYQPIKDFRKIYDKNTRLAELSKDEEALLILKETLPSVYFMIVHQDKENINLTFDELSLLFFMGMSPEKVEKATQRIFELIRW